MQELIENMESIGSKISEELTLRFKAQYAAFMENDYDVAIGYINQAIEMNENIHYARLVKFDIAEKFGDIKTMKDIADYFKKVELRQRYNDNMWDITPRDIIQWQNSMREASKKMAENTRGLISRQYKLSFLAFLIMQYVSINCQITQCVSQGR